jgi:hypothetical protein
MYHYTERLGLSNNDNLIDYKAGLISLKVDIDSNQITLETNIPRVEELTNCRLAVQCMLEAKDPDISYVSDTKITIKITSKTLENYLSYVIQYFDMDEDSKREVINAFKGEITKINNNISPRDD